jgi:hypothetical protein
MTKLHLKYVQSFGGYHYFRRRGSPRIPLPGVVGSAEFMLAYQAALAAAPIAIGADKRSKPGCISLALAGYFDSLPFRDLSNGTRMSRRCILERFRDQHGHLPAGIIAARVSPCIARQHVAPSGAQFFESHPWLHQVVPRPQAHWPRSDLGH